VSRIGSLWVCQTIFTVYFAEARHKTGSSQAQARHRPGTGQAQARHRPASPDRPWGLEMRFVQSVIPCCIKLIYIVIIIFFFFNDGRF